MPLPEERPGDARLKGPHTVQQGFSSPRAPFQLPSVKLVPGRRRNLPATLESLAQRSRSGVP